MWYLIAKSFEVKARAAALHLLISIYISYCTTCTFHHRIFISARIHSDEEYKPYSNLRDHNHFNEQRGDPFTNSKVVCIIASVNNCKLHAVLHKRFVAVTIKRITDVSLYTRPDAKTVIVFRT